MISAYVNKRLETISKLSQDGKRVEDLFSLLLKKDLWLRAYGNIASNEGATTEGPDGITQDGFSEGRVENLIQLLREGRYHSKPVRRTYIPKSNGKLRPLGIPAGDEKLLQEVVRHLLECVYEPIFSRDSHGFRPNLSCHTALTHVQTWKNSSWFIEFDIKGYFDNIDHQLLIKVLEKRINDRKFIGLIRNMLKAGYLEDWNLHRTYSGTPQGGVVSPLLANIFLHELDEYIASIQGIYNTGKVRKSRSEYIKVTSRIRYIRLKLKKLSDDGRKGSDEWESLLKEMKAQSAKQRSTLSKDPKDPDYRRLWYCRYADDFLLGFIGPREEALGLQNLIESFLTDSLKLDVAREKSGVTHSMEKIQFLGYNIHVVYGSRMIRKTVSGTRTTIRTTSGQVRLTVPDHVGAAFCKKKGYGLLREAGMKPRPYLMNHSEVEIISLYNAELRGLANYYCLAKDVKQKLHFLCYIGTYSCMATLAAKHKRGITWVAKRARSGSDFVWKYKDSKGKKKSIRLWQLKHLGKNKSKDKSVDVTPNPYLYSSRTELVNRLSSDKCEYCSTEGGYMEVHHIRKLKDLKGKTLEPWERFMIERSRKTIVMCNHCHVLLHAGTLPDMRKKR